MTDGGSFEIQSFFEFICFEKGYQQNQPYELILGVPVNKFYTSPITRAIRYMLVISSLEKWLGLDNLPLL